MNGFRRITVALAAIGLGAIAAADAPRTFIPWSPLTETELAKEREEMKRTPGLNDAYIENELRNEDRFHAYRDADILAAYPEVRGHQRLSACTNSIMSGATEFVFLASKRKNEVTLETIRCSRAPKGLSCDPLQREERVFFDGSDRYFTLEGLTLSKAKELLDAYAAGRVTNMPDWMSPKQSNISAIKALPDNQFEIIFGDFLCAGCVTRFTVKPEEVDGDTRLVIGGQPDTICF